MIMFRDWQANPNSIFGEGDIRPRPQMDDWFCISQEPIRWEAKTRTNFENERQANSTAKGDSISCGGPSVSPVPLPPEDSSYGRTPPRPMLKMNSRRSAL